jgi:hypothetical protein
MIEALVMLAEAATATLPMPSFLAGCWEQRREEERWTEECWTTARGQMMIGSGRAGSGDKVGNWEWMRIERAGDGSITFYASPNGKAVVPFKASAADSKSITFVNATHDFPQRVRYQRTNAGVDAEISLADGSKPVRWSYRRPGGAPHK